MTIKRRIATAATAAALMIGGLGIWASTASTAGAVLIPVDAHGTASCAVSTAKATFKPALVAGGTAATNVTFKAKFTCTGTSGVVSGMLKATGTASNNDCAGDTAPTIAGNPVVKWKAPPGTKYNPSTIATPNVSLGLGADFAEVDLFPTPITSGSFSGQHVSGVLPSDQSGATFVAACSTPKKGVKSLTFNGVNGLSTLTFS